MERSLRHVRNDTYIAWMKAGVINLWTAIPIVLGDNIGTTITAALASIGTNVNAKRTALAHALFNLVGTGLLVATFLIVFGNAAGINAPAFFHLVDACTSGNGFAGANPGRHVAMAHTLFNVTNVVVLAFFIPQLARLCRMLIHGSDESRVTTLEPHLVETPTLALKAVQVALADLVRRAWTVASVALKSTLGQASVSSESIEAAEREIDEMRDRIRNYLVEVSQHKLTAKEARAIPELIHCANDAERISDLALKVSRKTERLSDAFVGASISAQVSGVVSKVRKFAHETIDVAREAGQPDGDEKRMTEEAIRAAIREAESMIWSDPQIRNAHPASALAILSIFHCLRDITRHLGNIAVRVAVLPAK